ncbi:tRNA (uracil-5-)-methyltransferase [Oceanospirillum multiglobuliferum]|uniref:tRNA/tmRNA (uracil-C(5))-methyltransferase n=1 Tax=Oceanospirillum multiglobuliferum TaxID=64969 RepID=A0A1T4LI19_9GAMM|nr:tRNA (uridine(54)-C5)-methyltransferase TrmA [Oceanospirillum multiglobuliferum]OPX56648.1 tRNA (uridine(54)-C5)-methyltransferase TrmA [Oceanospirillum multiglobuliferum]SJZ54449.1 tRNA (uracil-5-)-methyltransferase [Oceanospirillum multiglobuliferum]
MALPVVEPEKYSTLLDEKAERIRTQFAAFNPPELQVFASPDSHYRMRSEFRVWHSGDDLFYVMFDMAENDEGKAERKAVRMDQYPIASQQINTLMSALVSEIQFVSELRRKLFQVEFLTTLSGEALITLIYHRALTEEWETLARALGEKLNAHIIGRSRKQRIVLTQDFVTETLQVGERTLHYQQVESSFTQPNAKVCEKMLEWATNATQNIGGDLVELYCGNGNFTLALAENFDSVLATEISKTSVKSAQYNIQLNKINNVDVVRVSSEEFSDALAGKTQMRRLSDIDLNSKNFTTVLVDPPRAGLDDSTVVQVAKYHNIVYISCNPDTLAQNLTELCKTHRIERFALFDQFPYTHHVETGVFLVKK